MTAHIAGPLAMEHVGGCNSGCEGDLHRLLGTDVRHEHDAGGCYECPCIAQPWSMGTPCLCNEIAAHVDAKTRFSIHDNLTCHEGVTRRGEFQPCDKTATAFRYDDEGHVYPVCARHSRREMVPLTLARFYLSTRPAQDPR